MITERVPNCPDCGEPAKRVRGNYFRCPTCRAIWQEMDWERRIANEQALFAESERQRMISSLIVIGELHCDKCGKIMRHEEKYCYNSSELVDIARPSRGKRYCVECSLAAGYLRMVRDKKTGQVYPTMFVLKDEEIVG